VSTTESLADAYAQCEAITRRAAANFYYGIRLLPRERRRAMCAVYAFARRVDDIGDGALGPAEKLRRLDGHALALAEIERTVGGTAAGSDAVMVALADAYTRFSLPAGALGELIEGVRMDVNGVTYERFDELVTYCRRVAGAIGRVCLEIFGLRDEARPGAADAQALADDLGVALQLPNILRDVAEDAGNGRVYLPREDLRRFELTEASLLDPGAGEQLAQLVRFEAARAREWFERGMALAPLLDRRSAACLLAMAGIYRRLLDRIEARPEDAMRRRVSLPTHEKAWVAARGMLVGGAR